MRSFIKSFLLTIFLLSPNIVIAEGCNDYTSSGSQICEQYYSCKWENNSCTERCPTDNNTCTNWSGCYDTGYLGCLPCDPGTYNNTNGANNCTPCSYSTGQIFDTAYANTYGLSTCPWICDSGYYRGGADDDTCIQCTDNLTCFGAGLEYSNPVSNDIYCTGNTQIVYNDTTHTYSCQSCDDSNATLENGNCKCNQNYYGTIAGLHTQCNACPSHSTTNGAGSTSISACKCASGYYRGGTNMDECIQCTGELSCSGTGLTYSNTSTPNGFSCSDGWQLVPDDTTHTYSCQSCRDPHATLENGNCKCNQNYYGTIAGLDTNCELCPLHSTTDGAGSTGISACKCNIGYYDTESGTDSVSCTACPSNSTTDVAGSTGISACKCNIGYYDTESGTDSVSCTKCPIGMTTVTLVNGNPTNTTTNGATSIEHCAMLATSEFCFTNPNSTNKQLICTPLIPSSATKINDRTISTTTNSGN